MLPLLKYLLDNASIRASHACRCPRQANLYEMTQVTLAGMQKQDCCRQLKQACRLLK
jgi:hypothetical protein